MVRESDIESNEEISKMMLNSGFYFQLPDCFLMIYKPHNEEKVWKTLDFPIIKAWVD